MPRSSRMHERVRMREQNGRPQWARPREKLAISVHKGLGPTRQKAHVFGRCPIPKGRDLRLFRMKICPPSKVLPACPSRLRIGSMGSRASRPLDGESSVVVRVRLGRRGPRVGKDDAPVGFSGHRGGFEGDGGRAHCLPLRLTRRSLAIGLHDGPSPIQPGLRVPTPSDSTQTPR